MTAMMSVGIVLLAAALFGLFYFRRRYMRLYEAVQQFQKQILEGQAVWPGPDTEAAEEVIRDAFLRIQKKYDREAESLQRDREAVQGLISDLSHQLKTPLANIRLYQDLLKNREISLKQREKMEHTLEILTQETGMKAGQIRCGMHIFSELGLMEWQETPFSYRIKQSGKVSLQDSRLRCRLKKKKKDL